MILRYYPNGMRYLLFHSNDTLERQHGLNQYDFGARRYDPARPGTTTMDPLAERRPWESPYLWCAGNPVRNIDPTGLFSFENIDKNSHYPLIVVFPQQFAIDRVLKMDYEASRKVKKEGLTGKDVFIEACNVAVNGGEKLIEKFSSQTNSTVIAPTHPILAGYQYDGSNGLTRHPIVNSIVGLIRNNYSNEYKMSVKGASAVSVFNLSIDKDAGFSWDKGNKNIIKRLFE